MKKFFRKFFRFVLKVAMWFFIISIGSVILFRWVPVPATPLMFIRCVQQKMNGKEMTLKKSWVSLDEISPHLQLAVVCSEDQNFIRHHGFDFDAIDRAMDYNKTHQRKRGASTVSQQVAKNVFLWPGRSWVRKGFEAYFTFLIELFWSKERIMEVYLNVAEMGSGVYGAEAASQKFFHKKARNLTQGEAALLVCVLPNPMEYNAGRPGAYLIGRQQWVMHQMYLWGGKLDYHPQEKSSDKK